MMVQQLHIFNISILEVFYCETMDQKEVENVNGEEKKWRRITPSNP